MFVRGDVESVKLLMGKFCQFSDATGLKANQAKCKVYFGGVSMPEYDLILPVTGFRMGELPFKYLGVPFSSRKLSIHLCSPLIDRIFGESEALVFSDVELCWPNSINPKCHIFYH